jgi:hypothetical protein
MAVLPTFSRGIWVEALAAVAKFVRSYFVTQSKPRGGATVLSFPHGGCPRPWTSDGAEEEYVTKKASAGVCWNSDQTPQEGGRA